MLLAPGLATPEGTSFDRETHSIILGTTELLTLGDTVSPLSLCDISLLVMTDVTGIA